MFLTLFATFCLLSLLAVGGANAMLPEMYRILVAQNHWLDATTFAQLYAVAQAAPGPNILVASLMGWQIAGLSGLAAATLGMLLPAATLAYTVGGLAERLKGKAWLAWVKTGLVPVAIGLIFAAGVTMARASAETSTWWLALTLPATIVVWRTEYSPLWVLAAGGVVGLVVG